MHPGGGGGGSLNVLVSLVSKTLYCRARSKPKLDEDTLGHGFLKSF